MFCFALGLGAPASAQESAEIRARSLALFKESAVHYEAGRYSVAAALLEEAYALHPEPKLLYNLGRARESGGETARAVEAYEAYLQTKPSNERRAQVQERIDQLKKAEPALVPTPAANPGKQPAAVLPAPSLEPPQQAQAAEAEVGGRGRTVPWILVGSGGALLVTALTVGLIARSEHQQADKETVQAEAVTLQQTAERKALVANLLAGAGGALIITGGAWLVLDGRRESGKRASSRRSLAWSVRVRPSGLEGVLRY